MLAICAGTLGLLSLIPTSRIFVVSTSMSMAPETDLKFSNWLKSQPGVVPHTVNVVRDGGHHIQVTFLMSQDGWNNPPFPAIESACASLGYRLVQPFEDVGQPEKPLEPWNRGTVDPEKDRHNP